MTKISTKVAVSAFAIAALLASPAFAKKAHQVSQDDNGSVVSSVAPGNDIPAYSSDGSVVGIANPDQYGAQSQR
jgi:hypothetical protein